MSRRAGLPARVGVLAFPLALGGVVLVLASTVRAVQEPDFRDSPFLRIDPERIVLSERDTRVPCGECHEAEYEVWRETPHATGFSTMHRTESAQDILRSMDLNVTKRKESLCMRCHYTVKAPDLEAIAGVSCESCHGPAEDWIDIHNDWGEGVEHPDDETAAHREQRVQAAEAAGMLRPSGDLYSVAANCFECHTVPMEELVNTGGHKAGSGSFELVEWSAEIRHNFVHRQWGEEGGNREPSAQRKRIMYLVGKMLDYEYGLRGLAEATEEGKYSAAMQRRVSKAYRALDGISKLIEVGELDQALEAGADVDLVPNNREALMTTAEAVRDAGRSLTSDPDRPGLEPLDPLVAGQPVAQVVASAGGGAGGRVAGGAPPDRAATGGGGGTDAPAEAPSPEPTPTELAAEAPTLPGEVRRRPAWFPDPDGSYEVTLTEECLDCHDGPDFDHPHESAHFRLLNKEPAAVRIASLYGISADQMALGTQICMNCHGTIPTATPDVPVFKGVACEACHGPSSGYLEPHQDGGNPQLGMTDLKDEAVRAANCARCHHVTDERLLAAGHPSGAGYDFAEANATLEHWPDRRVERRREGAYPRLDPGALASAYRSITAARPVPDVEVVAAASPTPSSPSGASDPSPPPPAAGGERTPARAGETSFGTEPATVRTASGGTPAASSPPRPPATLPSPTTSVGTPVEIQALPQDVDSMTTEELLLLVKRRLEALYRLLGRSGG